VLFQRVELWIIALSVVSSFRMHAVIATLNGLPARRRRVIERAVGHERTQWFAGRLGGLRAAHGGVLRVESPDHAARFGRGQVTG
jgi:hypothetical protein